MEQLGSHWTDFNEILYLTQSRVTFFYMVKGRRTAALRLIVQPCDEDEQFFYPVFQVMEHQWNEIDRGKPTTRRKTCPSATLSRQTAHGLTGDFF
jgi:hypothetical protein